MAAPSFSSFPPVFDSFPDVEPGSSSQPQTAQGSESTKLKKRKDKKEQSNKEPKAEEKKERRYDSDKREKRKERKLKRSDKKTDRDDEREHSSKHRKRRSISRDEDREYESPSIAKDYFNNIFYVDRKGDELNIRYGSLHSGDVPKHWHVARGKKVLGLEPHLAVLYRGNKGLEIGEAGWFSRSPQLTDSRSRAQLMSGHTSRLTTSDKAALKYEEVDGFIRISFHKGKEKDRVFRAITLEDDQMDSDSSPEGEESESSDEQSDASPLSAREEMIRDLEQRLAEEPASEPTWLSLLHHSIRNIDPSSKNADRARAEISVSILDRAVSAHPANTRSPSLRFKLLKSGEVIWDKTRMTEEWQKALKAIPTSDMYSEWLDWVIRASLDFNTAIERAGQACSFVTNAGTDESADFAKLRVFWRIATFLRQAGYVERGFALFQAQAELAFNVPEDMDDLPLEKRLDALEEFWESEVPRIGEDGARGWKAWKLGERGTIRTRAPRISKCESSDPYTIWHFNEAEADERLIIPTRLPSDEGSDHANEGEEEAPDEDPYSAVLFSDIRPFLVDLRTLRGREMLRLVWLSYLGLHLPGLSSALSSGPLPSDDRWADAYFLRSSFIQSLFPRHRNQHGLITSDSQSGVIIGREKAYAKAFDAVKFWTLGILEPLEGLTVNGSFRTWSKGCLEGLDSEIVNVMRRIFKLGWQYAGPHPDIDIMELAFEASFPQDEIALRHSQSMLSENSSSAELLAAHAYLERTRRKYEKARKVYRVGLQSLAQTNRPQVVCLWWGAAELEWLLSKNDAALEIIFRSAGQPNEKSGVNILRARRRLEELCQQGAVPEWKYHIKWMRLRILLELLIGSLDSAVEVSQRLLACQWVGSVHHESLTVAVLVMVYQHTVTLHNPAPPSTLRNLVHAALDVYPDNSIIIGIFLECEKGESVWGRVKTLMSESYREAFREKSVARRLIEVWIANWEEGRWIGEVERVRAGLEVAVSSDRTKGSPILWKVYVKFEIAAGNVKRAKAVLFRALKECPLVKELYLLAFEEELQAAYTRRELVALSDTMAERGIRLRHSLGEVLEVYGRENQERGTDSEASVEGEYEDELEYESRERKRLMPY